jgi:hypothetical protein
MIKREHANGQPLNAAYLPFLQGVDAALIDFCYKSIEHSKRLAAKWLSRSMYRGDTKGTAQKIAEHLINIDKYPNHGSVINFAEARAIGLNVVYKPFNDPVWQAIWRLYARYLVYMREKTAVKIFENSDSSVMF